MDLMHLQGVLTYHVRTGRRVVLKVAAVSVLLELLIPLSGFIFPDMKYSFYTSLTPAVLAWFLVGAMFVLAHSDTRFLLGRPITRRTVWIGNIVYIVGAAAACAVLGQIAWLVELGVVSVLKNIRPEQFTVLENGWQAKRLLTSFWTTFRVMLLVSLYVYCYACCFRRWKGWTLGLSIALPVIFVVVTVLPVYLSLSTLVGELSEAQTETEIMRSVMTNTPYWVRLIQDVAQFIQKYFQIIIWCAAGVSLPVSFAVMRTTRQPGN